MEPYIIVTASSSDYGMGANNLSSSVNKLKEKGYKCAGGINIISMTILTTTYYKFAQAMEKDEK